MSEECQYHSRWVDREDAIGVASNLNFNVPDGEPKWVIEEDNEGRWEVIRYDEREAQ